MSEASRKLQVGDRVVINASYHGKPSAHVIVERINWQSQSGIGFLVEPRVPKSSGRHLDADWFEPAQSTEKP